MKSSRFHPLDVLNCYSFFSTLTTPTSGFYLMNSACSGTCCLCHALIDDLSTRNSLSETSFLSLPLFCIYCIFLISGMFLLICLSCKYTLILQLSNHMCLRGRLNNILAILCVSIMNVPAFECRIMVSPRLMHLCSPPSVSAGLCNASHLLQLLSKSGIIDCL